MAVVDKHVYYCALGQCTLACMLLVPGKSIIGLWVAFLDVVCSSVYQVDEKVPKLLGSKCGMMMAVEG